MGVIRSKEVKIRKPQICWGCGATYPVGTRMGYVVCVDGGVMHSAYWCNICQEYTKRGESDDEYEFKSIVENDREAWESIKRELEETK